MSNKDVQVFAILKHIYKIKIVALSKVVVEATTITHTEYLAANILASVSCAA